MVCLPALKKYLIEDRGSVSVLVALALVVLIGSVALVIDAGLLYLNRVKMINALDSAVLAGVQELPGHSWEALHTANAYGVLNGLSSGEGNFEVDSENLSITGNANREVELLFARVLGINNRNITVHSKAMIAPVSSVVGVAPFGVLEDDFTFGQEIILKEGAGDNTFSGWYGALSLGGTGASNYEINVKNGYHGEISVGDIIETESGNMSGPTQRGIEYRIGECHHVPRCTIDSMAEGCSRILIIPIININEINGGEHTATVKVVGFAAFLVENCPGNGQDSEVKGSFIRYVLSGKANGSAADFGLYRAELCQ